MNEGGYSRLEKDFLGNERMVHYDGSGNMVGASDVVRESDGTIRIPNEAAAATTTAAPAADPSSHLPKDAGVRMRQNEAMPVSKVITYVFATFIGTMLLTLAILSIKASGGRTRTPEIISAPSTTPYSSTPSVRNDPQPDVQPNDGYPNDPKPRNDEDPDNAKPYDQTAPDMNSGDDSHPKIDDNASKPDNGKPKSDDPIDLHGDGEGKAGTGGTSKTDPNDIH